MGYKCCINDCPTGKTKKNDSETNEESDEIQHEEQTNDEKEEIEVNCENDEKKNDEHNNTNSKIGVFSFPHKDEDIERRLKWIHFVNRKNFKVTAHTRICELHFEEKYINRGVRNTLIKELRPIPTIRSYADDVPASVKHTPSQPPRKPPTKRYGPNEPREDELKRFRLYDTIDCFEQLDASYAPNGFSFKTGDKQVTYYEMKDDEFDIPYVNASIRVDEKLHVKLFLKGIPVPHPEWFRKNNNIDCKLTSRGMLENFATHIKASTKLSLLDELQKIKHLDPKGRPPFSADVMRFALRLRYTSKQAYDTLLEEFPLPSLSLLQKLNKGGKDSLKAVKLLLENDEIDRDVVLLLDEMHLQSEENYSGGTKVGRDEQGNLYKGILNYMIVGIRKNIPFVVRAVPEVAVSGSLVRRHIDEVLKDLHETGFNVRTIIADNHSTNVNAYDALMKDHGVDTATNAIIHPSSGRKIYLMFDTVHLIKNVRNNLLHNKRFIFPKFHFDGFHDDVNVTAGEVRWKNLHDVYEHDQLLDANLKLAPKLSYRALHPGDNKQNVALALSIFHRTTSAAIRDYFPENEDAASFLQLIDTWWTVVNSKQEVNSSNRLGDAAVAGDQKPEFLRSFADWVDEWSSSQVSNSQQYTLTAQTSRAITLTSRAIASLIEDLLDEGYSYVMIARFSTDPLERRFSRYRQMSGGRFLVSLREVLNSEKIITITSLLKAGFNTWEEDLNDDNINTDLNRLVSEVRLMNLQDISLSDQSLKVCAYIGGFIVRRLVEKKKPDCKECKTNLLDHGNLLHTEYVNLVSRGGLKVPSLELLHYTASVFGILEAIEPMVRNSNCVDRYACEHLLKMFGPTPEFVCHHHNESTGKIANRMIINCFYNNMQKESKDAKRKCSVTGFKKRQRTKND